MGKLTDIQIRDWIKRGDRFEERGDGEGFFFGSGRRTPCQAGYSAIDWRARRGR
jgi:hypothetical protein